MEKAFVILTIITDLNLLECFHVFELIKEVVISLALENFSLVLLMAILEIFW